MIWAIFGAQRFGLLTLPLLSPFLSSTISELHPPNKRCFPQLGGMCRCPLGVGRGCGVSSQPRPSHSLGWLRYQHGVKCFTFGGSCSAEPPALLGPPRWIVALPCGMHIESRGGASATVFALHATICTVMGTRLMEGDDLQIFKYMSVKFVVSGPHCDESFETKYSTSGSAVVVLERGECT